MLERRRKYFASVAFSSNISKTLTLMFSSEERAHGRSSFRPQRAGGRKTTGNPFKIE